MNRWRLSLVVLLTFLVAGVKAFASPGPDSLSDVRAATKSATKLTQTGPEKKPTPAPTASPAQAAPAPSAQGAAKGPGAGWAVNCSSAAKDKELQCRMSQTLVLKKGGQVLSKVTFQIPADTKKLEIVVQMPLGVYLPAGATFQVDESTPQQLNFRTCGRNGCYATSPVSPEVLDALRKGKQLTIGFQNLAEKPITLPLSLDGFAESYDKMQKPS
jgi:invasion protein IalB